MAHNHSHHGHHHVDPDAGDMRVALAVGVNLLLTVAQVVGGVLAGSLALIADALHNFSDAISLVIAFGARRIARRPSDEAMTFFTKHLKKGLNDLQAATMWFVQNAMAKPDNAGAGSYDYMHLFGLVTLGYMWALQAKAAQAKLAAGEGDKQFMEAKLATARYFMERIMPETAAHLARISSGADSMMALSAEAF